MAYIIPTNLRPVSLFAESMRSLNTLTTYLHLVIIKYYLKTKSSVLWSLHCHRNDKKSYWFKDLTPQSRTLIKLWSYVSVQKLLGKYSKLRVMENSKTKKLISPVNTTNFP